MAKTKDRYVRVKSKNKAGYTVTKWKDTKTGKILDTIPFGANVKPTGGELGVSTLSDDVKESTAQRQEEFIRSNRDRNTGPIGGLVPDQNLISQAIGREKEYKASQTADPVKRQYDANVAMFRHNIESGYFSDQQIKSFAKSFYEFENTFDSKKYFDMDPEFNYVANNTEMARYAEQLAKQNIFEAEATNPLENESNNEVAINEGKNKATSKQNQTQPPDANDDTTSEIDPSYMGGDNSPGTVSAEQRKINKWFEDTANSPAAQAFKEGTEQQQTEWGKLRLAAKKKHEDWKLLNNRR